MFFNYFGGRVNLLSFSRYNILYCFLLILISLKINQKETNALMDTNTFCWCKTAVCFYKLILLYKMQHNKLICIKFQVVRFLDDGILLQRPDGCPSTIYHIMLGCWKKNPKERIPFHKIHKHLVDFSKEILRNVHHHRPILDSENEA